MLVIFFAVWLILNAKVTAEICVLGVLILAALFFFICRFMGYSWRKELGIYRLLPLFVQYFGVLVAEIVKANLCVFRMVVSPDQQPEPAFVCFQADLKTEAARVMLANSITLTPGTITVMADGDQFCVHCLDKELSEGIGDSVFVKLLKKMEAEEERWR